MASGRPTSQSEGREKRAPEERGLDGAALVLASAVQADLIVRQLRISERPLEEPATARDYDRVAQALERRAQVRRAVADAYIAWAGEGGGGLRERLAVLTAALPVAMVMQDPAALRASAAVAETAVSDARAYVASGIPLNRAVYLSVVDAVAGWAEQRPPTSRSVPSAPAFRRETRDTTTGQVRSSDPATPTWSATARPGQR